MDNFFNFINNIIDKIIKNEKLNSAIKKFVNKETFMYLVFGVLTTIVNLVSFKYLDIYIGKYKILGDYGYQLANFIAWFLSVVFAYITNKLWVFESKSFRPSVLLKEILGFFGARVLSYFIEAGGLWAFVTAFHVNKMVSKILIAVVVIIFNYVFSKLIVFRKKPKSVENDKNIKK